MGCVALGAKGAGSATSLALTATAPLHVLTGERVVVVPAAQMDECLEKYLSTPAYKQHVVAILVSPGGEGCVVRGGGEVGGWGQRPTHS